MGKESAGQLSLFDSRERGEPVRGVEPSPHHRRLAERLPSSLYLGTSSWSFPGWKDLVYDRKTSQSVLARHGLAAYATHPLFRCVGIDRTFYAPLSAADFAAYREAVPEDFRFVVKAHELVTRAYIRPRSGEGAPARNGFFLHRDYAVNEVIGPCVEGLEEKAAILVFQFSPQSPAALGGIAGFAENLYQFLDALPPGLRYAVELRNPEMLTPSYLQALTDSGACHCFNVHPTMPPIESQWQSTREADFPALLVRWMLQRHLSYGNARDSFAPFNQLVEEDERSRSVITEMCLDSASKKRPAIVVVNNKAEGSAPLSVFRLAEELAR
jgi:uncharacterized protein YecE (DUF72 family)